MNTFLMQFQQPVADLLHHVQIDVFRDILINFCILAIEYIIVPKMEQIDGSQLHGNRSPLFFQFILIAGVVKSARVI